MSRGRHRRSRRHLFARPAAAALPPLVAALTVSGGAAISPVATATWGVEPNSAVRQSKDARASTHHSGWPERHTVLSSRQLVGRAAFGDAAPRALPGPTSIPEPSPPVRLPKGVEAAAPYVGQVSCDPRAKAGVSAFAKAVPPGGSSARPALRLDARGERVMQVQRLLGVTAVSGWFGPKTELAVKHFQRRRQLPVSGVVDVRTWAALDAQARAKSASTPTRTTTTGTTPLSSYPTTVLRYGSRGDAVRALQTALGVTPRSGWFGPATRSAVRRFQERHDLSDNGIVDRGTWKRIERVVYQRQQRH